MTREEVCVDEYEYETPSQPHQQLEASEQHDEHECRHREAQHSANPTYECQGDAQAEGNVEPTQVLQKGERERD